MAISLYWLKIIERFLMAVLLCSCVYIFYFLRTKDDLSKSYAPPKPAAKDVLPTQELVPQMPAYQDYAEDIKKRDLFSSSSPSSLSPLAVNTGALPSSIKVVGVILGPPAEVIVEDTNSHKTVFVKQGQTLQGMSIEKVQGQQIILNYQGQSIPVPLKRNE